MRRTLRPLATLAVVALMSAGCGSHAPSKAGTASAGTARNKGLKFAKCMRDNGVAEFPDPDANGELTIDAIANRSSLDPNTAAFKQAVTACKDLEPPGFTGRRRSADQQTAALKFSRCMRDNGVKDFPDPTPDAPLIDTTRIPSAAGKGAHSIPGFQAAVQKCRGVLADALAGQR